MTPDVPGHWRWVGTKTLFFEADVEGIDRFPMATEYTVAIPAGVQSANGSELAQTVTFSFRTPPPVLGQIYPSGGHVMFLFRVENNLQPLIETVILDFLKDTFALPSE